MVKTLLKHVKEFKTVSILTPTFTALEVLVEVLIPYVTAWIIDRGIQAGNMSNVYKYGGLMLVMAFLGLTFGVLAGRFGAKASTGFGRNLRRAMYDNIQTFSFSNIDKFSTGGLVTRMTTDVTNVQNSYQAILRIAVRAPLNFITSMVMCFVINTKISLTFLGFLAIMAVGAVLIMGFVTGIFKKVFKKYDELNASVQENISAIRVVKAFVREKFENKKFTKASDNIYRLFLKAEGLMAGISPIMILFIFTLMYVILWQSSHYIVMGDMEIGQITSLISYILSAMISMFMLVMVFIIITMSIASGERICQVLDETADIVDPENPIKTVENGSIDFENVSFTYPYSKMVTDTTEEKKGPPSFGKKKKKEEEKPPEPNKPVLTDINLHIGSGETIGIIGSTGCGKSSFVNLISRLYDVTEGSVKVAGHDVKEYGVAELRDAVSVVLQKNELFTGTILDNLRWGKEDATEEECIRACQLACAHDFIMEFPDGYNTMIEQGGTNVSGGQKQRICIARALLKSPKILILDDSTSAVDTATDAAIRRSFKEDIPNTTKIIISQRISSIENADKIIVLEKGRVNGFGTHRELLENNTIYKEIFETQQKGTGDFDIA